MKKSVAKTSHLWKIWGWLGIVFGSLMLIMVLLALPQLGLLNKNIIVYGIVSLAVLVGGIHLVRKYRN